MSNSAKETGTIDARVKCENCGRGSYMRDTLVTRPVFGLAHVTEVGIRCPNCGHYRRAYWDAPAVAAKRINLKDAAKWLGTEGGRKQYAKAKIRYGREFDRLQAQVAERLGQPLRNAEDHLGAEIAIKVAEAREAIE